MIKFAYGYFMLLNRLPEEQGMPVAKLYVLKMRREEWDTDKLTYNLIKVVDMCHNIMKVTAT